MGQNKCNGTNILLKNLSSLKRMKKYLFTLIACMCSVLSWAVEIDGINYSLDYWSEPFTASVISKSDKYSGDIVIPSEVTYNGKTYKVTSIVYRAFYGCSSLTSVYCKPATPPAGDSDSLMFSGNASGRKIYVPMESVEAYKSAGYWKEYANSIEGYNF